MRFKLWHRIFLSIIVPVLVTVVIFLYQINKFKTIFQQIMLMEAADDINTTLLELRRYEKNILLFHEEVNTILFYENLRNLKRKVLTIEMVLVGAVGREDYMELQKKLSDYEASANQLSDNTPDKLSIIKNMRASARTIETILYDFKIKERRKIEVSISEIEHNLIITIILLLAAATTSGYLLSKKVITVIKKIERSFKKLSRGEFENIYDIEAPEEIAILIEVYNLTIIRLKKYKAELDKTLNSLEDANRELIEKQETIIESKKASAMRLIASEIAHEINNPLSSVTLMLGMFYEEIDDADPKKEDIRFILKEINRCQDVIRKLTDYARKEPLRLAPVNISELIKEVAAVALKQNISRGVNLITSTLDLPEIITIDRSLIYNALFNIISNAFESVPSGGSIEISASAYSEDNFAVITISDTGIGIPDEYIGRIFDPFFTTKKEQGGSGLGLAITRKIIESHHGLISVSTNTEKGTVFKIKLPIDQPNVLTQPTGIEL
ncbi:sensor histidine kinase [Candidatus Magnetominusculus xianensis]|uniref:histidine kinase n=1 Tax=Candidatus Magnetominusculus xianensis TaxID=1748249 RepID=A0ABR5SJ09_9BACT|nr:ATP-binding protein [Candidatus Magnetominusculus xianensis]KWT93236.1 two-component system sensor histidine kinase [Candidatus Magnetominusculus xianensis]MBF0404446.1 GHKL domain-containing protein [Nitrospirota bacterium]